MERKGCLWDKSALGVEKSGIGWLEIGSCLAHVRCSLVIYYCVA